MSTTKHIEVTTRRGGQECRIIIDAAAITALTLPAKVIRMKNGKVANVGPERRYGVEFRAGDRSEHGYVTFRDLAASGALPNYLLPGPGDRFVSGMTRGAGECAGAFKPA